MADTCPTPRTWEPTMRLRWRFVQLFGQMPILEQAWGCNETGEIEWRSLELVDREGNPVKR